MKPVLAILFAASFAIVIRADWPTYGGDYQRTGWAKSEDSFSVSNVKNMELQWKVKIETQNRELNSLTPPIVIEGVITPHGFKEYVIVAGASDTLAAVDMDNGKIVWQKKFEAAPADTKKHPPFWLCPNAQNATPVVNHWSDKNLPVNTVFALASDGKLHGLNVNNGEDKFPPTQFVPPLSKTWSLGIHDGVLYTTTSQGCGGTKSGVWAMDFRTPERKVTFVPSTHKDGAGVWGRAGAAIGKDRLFVETGDGNYDAETGDFPDSVLAVSLADQKLVDYYTPANRSYLTRKDLDMGNMSPVVFPYKDSELVAAAGKEGVIYLLDAANLGGADHRTPVFRSPLYANEGIDFAGRGFWGAFATWKDPAGARWLFAPALGPVTSKAPAFKTRNGDAPNGSIMAFKVEDVDGKPALTPMWMSRDLNVPEPPVVTNGVVFALSNGEFTGQAKESGGLYSSAERAEKRSGNAVLYAFDASSGKELFNSGKAIEGFTHFSGLAISSGHVLVTDFADNLYAFGVKQ